MHSSLFTIFINMCKSLSAQKIFVSSSYMCPIMCYKNGKVSNLTLSCDGASVWSTWLLKLIHPERQFCESMHQSWNIREAEMVLTVHSTQQQVFVTRVILRPSFFMMSSSTIPCRHMLISIACRQTKNNNGRKSQDNTSINTRFMAAVSSAGIKFIREIT